MVIFRKKLEVSILVMSLLFLQHQGFAESEKQTKSVPPRLSPDKPLDPFVTTDQIMHAAQQKGEHAFSAMQSAQNMPLIQLKGLIEGADKPPIALLDIQGFGIYLIHAGDAISLQSQKQNMVLRIKNITGNSVLVDTGTPGQIVVVR